MALRRLHFGFIDLVEGLADMMPVFLRRPFGRVVLLCYGFETALPFFLACLIVGVLTLALIDALPRDGWIPAVIGLAALPAIIWRQWWRIESLKQEIRDMREEEDAEYLSDNDMVIG